MSDYPEHDKLQAISERSQVCGEFLEWLQDHQGYSLCQLDEHERFFPVNPPLTSLLAEFFEIDQDEIEREKRAMLEELRWANMSVLDVMRAAQ